VPGEPDPKRTPDTRPALQLAGLRDVRLRDYLVRFALGAGVSIVAGVLGQVVSARFAGVFLAFPAILPASLTLIQAKEGTREADRNAIGAVLGALGLTVFAATAEAAFGRLDPWVALALALPAWVVVSVALYGLLAHLRPDACDKHQD
jgi:hypothetical protein